MSKRLYIKSFVNTIKNVGFRLCIVLSMVFAGLAFQSTSVYAYSSNEEINNEIKQIVLLESVGDWSNEFGTQYYSADDLSYGSVENAISPENGYSKHSLAGDDALSGGHVLAKIAPKPLAYNSPVVVQIYDTDGAPKSGVNVYAFNGTAYSGVSGVSNGYGTVTLTLPDGDYRFRADLNGTQFWSGTENTCSIPTCNTDVVIVSKPVSVTIIDTDGTAKTGLRVYAFDGTSYTGHSKLSDESGVATFTLPLGNYHFRADLYGTQFWSAETNDCSLPGCESTQVTVSKPVTVLVADTDGTPISGLNIYAFNGTTYSGYNKVSNAYGLATFTLPLGEYHFRADLNGTQFWSAETNHCILPGCENAQVTVSKPVTVTVLDTGNTPKEGLNVYAFDGTTYSGYSKVTDVNGEATFTLPSGDYRFRGDFNGTQFWSDLVNHCSIPDCEEASVIVTQPVTVTVVDTNGDPQYGLNVYAFDGAVYKNYSKTTNINGEAVFTLPQGDYRFRSDLNGTQFWSSTGNDCSLPGCSNSSVTVSIPVQVVVKNTLGEEIEAVPVYAFNGTSYANYNQRTNDDGIATLTLPLGEYRFRVDVNGEQIWSGEVNHCTIPSCDLVNVVLEAEATLTPTITATMTITPTPTSTKTNTRTATITNTPTATRTKTITLTGTNTRTFTPSATRTRTPTQTSTITKTPTRTPTQTITSTATRTSSHTITNTVSQTPTWTITMTPTLKATITRTPTSTSTQASCADTGSILRQSWNSISSYSISGLQTDPRYPSFPDIVDYPLSYKGPVNYGDYYGTRYRGYVCAPYDGWYRFYVSSDQDSELYLSTSTDPAGMSKIAYVHGWNLEEDWYKYASQQSEWLYLNAGQEYYTESYHAEGAGPDNFTVGWEGPNDLSGDIHVIDGNYLRPFVPEVVPTPQTCANVGSILRQRFTNISGYNISDLTSASKYPNNADYWEYHPDFDFPYVNTNGDYYGERWRGYICPPYDGDYIFYVAADDTSQLYLSTDTDPANMSLIAYNNTWTSYQEYYKQSSQTSETQHLLGGTLYYVEALFKEGTANDSFSVAWRMPYYSGRYPIQGEYLVPITPEPTYTPTITQTPSITLTPTISGTPTRTYTPSTTFTRTNTPTVTYTPTSTYTPTRTNLPTKTKTPTITYTPSRTYTPTITYTPTLTFTPSRTFTESNVVNTNTIMPTETALSPIVTVTPTLIYVQTLTGTPTQYIPPIPTNTVTLFGGG